MRLNAPETCVDHYTFWRVLPVGGVEGTVTLLDQFQSMSFETRLHGVEFLGNPARKIRNDREEEDIHHAKVHLLAYSIEKQMDGPPSNNAPIVRNQFTGEGGDRWSLGKTRFLLIPARKAHNTEPPPTTPPPPRVDHFLCYEVFEATPVHESMVIRDQFGTIDTHELRPHLFGVPVIKNEEGLIHPDVHLAIYRLNPGLHPPSTIGVNTADQLRRWQLNAVECVWLAVPSHKEWKRP